MTNGHPKLFDILGDLAYSKFKGEPIANRPHLDAAISFQARAVQLTKSDDPFVINRLCLLSLSLLDRFKIYDEGDDIVIAIQHLEQALSISREQGLPQLYSYSLDILSPAYTMRYDKYGNSQDLGSAIEYGTQYLSILPDDDEEKPGFMKTIRGLHMRRFTDFGNIHDVDKAIEWQARIGRLVHTQDELANHFDRLGFFYMTRFRRTKEATSIDSAIECYAKGVTFIPVGHKDVTDLLNNLGVCHSNRFDHLGALSDLNKAIDYYTQATSQVPFDNEGLPDRLCQLANLHTFRFQRLEQSHDINQAIGIYTQIVDFTSKRGDLPPAWINNLGNSYLSRFKRLGDIEDINQAIELHSRAVSLTSEAHEDASVWLNNLGSSYATRFQCHGELQDIDKAIEYHNRAVALTPETHPDLAIRLHNLGSSYLCRFEHLIEVTDMDSAIECHTKAVLLTNRENPTMLSSLGISHSRRSSLPYASKLDDTNKAIECFTDAIAIIPEGDAHLPSQLNSLALSYHYRSARCEDPHDLDQSIEYLERAVSLTPGEHVYMPMFLSNLGNSYQSRSEKQGHIEDLEKAINHHSRAVSLTHEDHLELPNRLCHLGTSYRHRFNLVGDKESIESSIKYFQQAAHCSAGHSYTMLTAAHQWAQLSSINSPASSILAYQKAMDSISDFVWLGTRIQKRYEYITAISDLAAEAAATAISAKEYSLAVEWLEQGRSIVWNQMLLLRTPLGLLSSTRPELAKQLEQVSLDLQSTISLYRYNENLPIDSVSLEKTAQQHHRLAERYKALLGQARLVPGVESLLSAKKIGELQNAVQDNPVVIINTHYSRCDGLVLMPGPTDVKCIALEGFSHEKANTARSKLLRELTSMGLRQRDGTDHEKRPLRPIDDLHPGTNLSNV